MRGVVVAVGAWCVLGLSSCHPAAPVTGGWQERELDPHAPGQAHAPDPRAAASTASAASAALDRALATAAAPAAVVDAALVLGARGGELGARRAAVVAAIDALSPEELAAARARGGDTPPAGALALRAARLAWHAGDDAAARAALAAAAVAADADEVAAAAHALAGEVAAAPIDPTVVAVILPLTGRYAAVGGELRAAIELAPAEGTRWLFLDSRGEAAGAEAAVAAAAARGAIAILGPVGAREALAAARAAAARGLPIGLLAPEDGADVDAGVFRLVSSTADEARAVARLGHDDNFPTVAVLAPRDDVGAEAAAAFVDEATRLGLTVTAQGSYDPTGGDLEPEVKRFLGLVPADNPRLAAHLRRYGARGWQTFTPDLPFSLLYLPDRYDRAALVAAFLPYLGVELRTSDFPDLAQLARKHGGRVPQVVQLVGGGGWHHPSLPVRGGAAVQGALIVDACAGELGGELAADAIAAFTARKGRAPSVAALQALDAATLVAHARAAVAAAAAPTRHAVAVALAHAQLDDGACGPASIGRDGELSRAPSLLEVDGEQLIVAP